MLVATLALATLAASTAAGPDSVPVTVDYAAPAGCPDGDAFAARVRARTSRARPPAPSEAAWRFHVRIQGDSDPRTGTLFSVDPRGVQSTRELQAARCDDLADALALMVAIAVDPESISRAPIAASASVAPPAPAASASTPVASARPKVVAAPAPAVEKPSVVAVGIEASLQGNVAPSFMPGAGVYALAHVAHGSLGLSLIAGLPQSEQRQAGTAKFWWWGARLLGCPRYVSFAGRAIAVAPCISFETGMISASGSDTPDAHTYRRPWYAPGLGLQAAWNVSSVVQVKLEGGASFPLKRDAFYFLPAERVHRPSAIGAWAALGVSWRVP